MHNNKWEGAGGGRRGGGARRDHYLSAPGREAATFGRGGGAGGFELNYKTKTKTKKDTNDTNIDGGVQQNINNITGGMRAVTCLIHQQV